MTIAVKIITTQSSPLRMLREIEIMQEAMQSAKKLKRMNYIIPIISIFEGQQIMGIIQPYIPHLPFESYYKDLNERQIFRYIKCLLTALKTVHNLNFVHRDVKPANFIFLPNLETGYLIDFGLSEPIDHSLHFQKNSLKRKASQRLPKNSQSNSGQNTSQLLCECDKFHNSLCKICWSKPKNNQERSGTPGYRSPEILQKSKIQGPAIDIWAAGCILIQILSWKAPFFPAKDQNDKTDKNKYLDNDSICFSHQLCLIGFEAMAAAMKELNLKMVLSAAQKKMKNINHPWTVDYLKSVCLQLRETELENPDLVSVTSDFESDFLFEICFKLLNPSYEMRLSAEEILQLLS